MVERQRESAFQIDKFGSHKSSFKVWAVSLILLLIGISNSLAQCNCNFTIPKGTSTYTFDGVAKGAKPGDVICLSAGNIKRVVFQNLKGTSSNYIKIVNCGGQAIVGDGTANGAFIFSNSQFIRLTGSGDPNNLYGIKVPETSSSAQGVSASNLSSDFEIDHLEITKVGFAGIMIKSDPSKDCAKTFNRPNFTLRNINIHDNYIHDISGEGVYIGNSYYNGTTIYCGSMQYPHEVRSVKIHNNTFKNTGWESIQVGSGVQDINIYNNKVTNYGAANVSGQNGGIQLGSGSTGKVYNNLVQGGSGRAVFLGGIGNYTIFNNVFVNTGIAGSSPAITMSISKTPLSTDIVANNFAGPVRIINNTFINENFGVIKESLQGPLGNVLTNNLIVGGTSSWLALRGDTDWNKANNIYIANTADAKFVNPSMDDYRLQSNSPAANTGKDVSTYGVTFDYDNKPRPVGLFDVGAFELSGTGNQAPVANAGADRTISLPTSTLSLTGSATDSDGTITAYTWTKQSGPATTLSGITTATLSMSGLTGGTYVFRLTVTDNGSLKDSDDVTVIVNSTNTNTSSTIIYRINTGGSSTISASPKSWISDSQSAKSVYLDAGSLNYTSGSSSWNGTNTTGAPNELFGPYRYSPNYTSGTPMQWNFPASNGTYEVSLFFAETPNTGGVSTSGARVFSVKMEGTTVLSNFDIYASGGLNAIKKVIQVTVSDGTLDIDFIRGIGNPQINGIEIAMKSTSTSASRMTEEADTSFDDSVQEEVLKTSLDIYPNPFQDQITITFSSDQKEVDVTLVNMAGQLMYKQSFTTGLSLFTLDLSQINLPQGLYILSITTEKGKVYRKVLKA